MKIINCQKCWKQIEQKGNRVLCIRCSNKRDREIARKYREDHIDEIRTKNREAARLKRDALKRDE